MTGGEEEVPGEYVYNGSVANKALELIGKELGMFIDNVNASSKTSWRRWVELGMLDASAAYPHNSRAWFSGHVLVVGIGPHLQRDASLL